MEVSFIHPDLGLGGAEQLVVNLAVSIQPQYKSTIFTPRFFRSFPPCHDGTLTVQEHGNFFGLIPMNLRGKLTAFMAYFRTILCALWVIFFAPRYEVIVVDQISPVVALLKLFKRKVIFYCHFPDKALCLNRTGFLRKCYRWLIDLSQELSLLFADKILVNSKYTQSEFYKQFSILSWLKVPTQILYPAIDTSQFTPSSQIPSSKYFLSLNRYQRKKNIPLAIKAFKGIAEKYPDAKLIIAGGYDLKIRQNVEHHLELIELTKQLGISSKVEFLCSIDNKTRLNLLANAVAVLYTPENQHFGIVPCQTMAVGIPVLACKSGGPSQSIEHEKTGYLLSADPKDWSECMSALLIDQKLGRSMGQAGRRRVQIIFGLQMMGELFKAVIKEVADDL